MQNPSIRYPAGPHWVHRGHLPSLTLAQAHLALAVAVLHVPECVSLSSDEPLAVRVSLGSGRTAVLRPELFRRSDGLCLRVTLDNVHEDDLPEVTRIHEDLVASFPLFARAIHAAQVKEVV